MVDAATGAAPLAAFREGWEAGIDSKPAQTDVHFACHSRSQLSAIPRTARNNEHNWIQTVRLEWPCPPT